MSFESTDENLLTWTIVKGIDLPKKNDIKPKKKGPCHKSAINPGSVCQMSTRNGQRKLGNKVEGMLEW